MSGPKRNPDKLNTIGVVVVGICGAVLVYVTIVALQAFYMDDTSEIQTMADYGGQDTMAQTVRAEQVTRIEGQSTPNARVEGLPQTYHVPVQAAMKRVVAEAQQHPGELVPAFGPSDHATIQPVFGRPVPLTMPGAGAAGSAAGTDGAGSGSGSDAGATGGATSPAPGPATVPPATLPAAAPGSGSAGPAAGAR